jgi:PPOX class probable F420-dependent enzyme
VSAPQPTRPGIAPGYGIAKGAEGLLEWAWVSERLERSRSYWICTVRADGRPHAMPVWGVCLDDTVYFGTDPGSVKARNLARDPRVAVHLESGDECVVLEGVAEPFVSPEQALFERVADAYETKYGGFRPEYPKAPGWFVVRHEVALAWLESDYPNTATRFQT